MTSAQLGIVFHTSYSGATMDDMKASFNIDIKNLNTTKDVWFRDAYFIDASGTVTFTESETEKINSILSDVGSIFKTVNASILNKISTTEVDEIYDYVLEKLVLLLRPYEGFAEVSYNAVSETILINSNFSVGFYINRETLYKILKDNYDIECIYDPCSYPGIQCKYYYEEKLITCEDDNVISQLTGQNIGEKLTSVSFMIFRTGSVLIVGKCSEKILKHIYTYLKTIFKEEYSNIVQNDLIIVKEKTKKLRKKVICVNNSLK
jgi:hypothetical protein